MDQMRQELSRPAAPSGMGITPFSEVVGDTSTQQPAPDAAQQQVYGGGMNINQNISTSIKAEKFTAGVIDSADKLIATAAAWLAEFDDPQDQSSRFRLDPTVREGFIGWAQMWLAERPELIQSSNALAVLLGAHFVNLGITVLSYRKDNLEIRKMKEEREKIQAEFDMLQAKSRAKEIETKAKEIELKIIEAQNESIRLGAGRGVPLQQQQGQPQPGEKKNDPRPRQPVSLPQGNAPANTPTNLTVPASKDRCASFAISNHHVLAQGWYKMSNFDGKWQYVKTDLASTYGEHPGHYRGRTFLGKYQDCPTETRPIFFHPDGQPRLMEEIAALATREAEPKLAGFTDADLKRIILERTNKTAGVIVRTTRLPQ
jgi:hypothetical protein